MDNRSIVRREKQCNNFYDTVVAIVELITTFYLNSPLFSFSSTDKTSYC